MTMDLVYLISLWLLASSYILQDKAQCLHGNRSEVSQSEQAAEQPMPEEGSRWLIILEISPALILAKFEDSGLGDAPCDCAIPSACNCAGDREFNATLPREFSGHCLKCSPSAQK